MLQRVAVVAYFSPGGGDWARLIARADTVGLAVMNPASGPGYGSKYELGGSTNNAYTQQISDCHLVGIDVCHYLSTNYRDVANAHTGDPYAGSVGVNFRYIVDPATDVFTSVTNSNVATAHNFTTGMGPVRVKAWNSGSPTATLAGGLSASTDYYFIAASTTTFKLAASHANALAGTPVVNVTSAGSQTSGSGSPSQYLGLSRIFANVQNVKNEVDLVLTRYPAIDGFFFDEMRNNGDATDIAHYQAIYDHVKSRNSSLIVIHNPGGNFPESMVGSADIFMGFEGTKSSHNSFTPSAWRSGYSSSKFWDAVHTASTGDEADAVADARAHGSGWVSFNGSSFSTLPPSWETFVDDVAAGNDNEGSVGEAAGAATAAAAAKRTAKAIGNAAAGGDAGGSSALAVGDYLFSVGAAAGTSTAAATAKRNAKASGVAAGLATVSSHRRRQAVWWQESFQERRRRLGR